MRDHLPLGIGWIFAIIVLLVAVLALLHLFVITDTVLLAMIVGLALALLL